MLLSVGSTALLPYGSFHLNTTSVREFLPLPPDEKLHPLTLNTLLLCLLKCSPLHLHLFISSTETEAESRDLFMIYPGPQTTWHIVGAHYLSRVTG